MKNIKTFQIFSKYDTINENKNIFRKKSLPTFDVDYDDLEHFITTNLKQRFDIAVELELGHDDMHQVFAKKDALHPDETDDLNEWLQNGECSNGFSLIGIIMNHLCDKGLIDEGNYIIKVL